MEELFKESSKVYYNYCKNENREDLIQDEDWKSFCLYREIQPELEDKSFSAVATTFAFAVILFIVATIIL